MNTSIERGYRRCRREGLEGLKGEGQTVKGAWGIALHLIKTDEVNMEIHTYPKADDFRHLF